MNPIDDLLIESLAKRPEQLRVALVTETFAPEINGVAMTLGHLVDQLLAHGHQVQLVRPQPSVANQLGRFGAAEHFFSAGFPIPNYNQLRFGLPSTRRLTALWKLRRPDIVHVATEGPLGWSAVSAARKLQIPVSSSFHTNFHAYSGYYGLGVLRSPIEAYLRKFHNRTLTTMVPTVELKTQLTLMGYRHVTLLPRGIDTEQFSPQHRSPALRQHWGATEHDVVALYVGRLAREKNVAAVINAYEALQRQNPRARLVLVGDGPLRGALQAACPDALFAGTQAGQELGAHYASADVFLFASTTETYGNVVPEALASGLAVLSYDHASASQLIDTGRNGITVPLNDEVQFCAQASRLGADPALRQRLRESARDSVEQRSWRAVYNTFVQVLRNTMALHDGSPGIAALQTANARVAPPPNA